MKTILFFTTADVTAGRQMELRRLFASVAAFRATRPDIRIEHHLLLQRCTHPAQAMAEHGIPDGVHVTTADGQLPLSVARNRMLATIAGDTLAPDVLVAFPDDDAWYPDGVVERVVQAFDDAPELDLWFCRYGGNARNAPDIAPLTPRLQQLLSYASSNTLFLRAPLLRAIGGFDETLGLGTAARSGEDTEFAMRAYHGARASLFVDARMVGHRDFDPAIRARYYAGSLIAIGRHAHHSLPARRAFARKLMVGVALTIRRELTLSAFIQALKTLARERRDPSRPAMADIFA